MNQILYVTQAGYEELKKKLEQLKKDQKENIIALQDARSQGDLSENADYDAARNAQSKIAAEIAELEANIKSAKIINLDEKNETNNLGKLVTVVYLDDEAVKGKLPEFEFQIVGTIEADVMDGKISSDSPLGKAILQARVGDEVDVRTEDGDLFKVRVVKVAAPKVSKKK